MSSFNELGLVVPDFEPREELVVVSHKPWSPFDVNERLELGAKTLSAMFDWDKSLSIDLLAATYQGLHDAVQADYRGLSVAYRATTLTTIPTLTVAEQGEDNPTFSDIVRAHDRLTTTAGESITETGIWPEIWRGRSAEYINKRLRGEVSSSLGGSALKALALVGGLHGTNKQWDMQQFLLDKIILDNNKDQTAVEAVNPVDWLMADAQAIVGGQPRPDSQSSTRFVQHDIDTELDRGDYGPSATASHGLYALLRSSDGNSGNGDGFRVLMGQKS